MLTPRQAAVTALLMELQRRNREQWNLPADLLQQCADPTLQFPHPLFRADGTPAPARPPAPCLPPIRTAVPVDLTPAQLLDLHAAIVTATDPGPRLRTFDQNWQCTWDSSRARAAIDHTAWQREASAQWEAQQHVRRNHGWATCPDNCPICALGIAPRGTDYL